MCDVVCGVVLWAREAVCVFCVGDIGLFCPVYGVVGGSVHVVHAFWGGYLCFMSDGSDGLWTRVAVFVVGVCVFQSCLVIVFVVLGASCVGCVSNACDCDEVGVQCGVW